MAIGIAYLFIAFPKVESASTQVVEATTERIARGEYLANHVTVCMDCHATHDWRFFSAPPVPGTEGMGGDLYGEEMGIPGSIYPGNLTPAGLGDWSDGEIMRAITSGVNKDGEALFPFMPYTEYRHLSEEDLFSIISYLRSLSPIENVIPKRKLNFPMNLIVRTIPEPAQPNPQPDPTDTMAYGKYLATISGCKFCHTPQEQGVPISGMEFAGGFEFPLPSGTVRSMNITPDRETGIGGWDEVTFINIFKSYNPDDVRQDTLRTDEYNTVMPWAMYSGMRQEDLGAIYDFLRSVPAIENRVQRFIPHRLGNDKGDN
ncbi:MAG: cytochrome C [bacterium]